MRWMGALAAFYVLMVSSCKDKVQEGRLDELAVSLPLPLQEANICARDFDCVDAGPFCPASCHVLIGAETPAALEVEAVLSEARVAVLEGKCIQDCSAPFWGATCQMGKCVARRSAPPRSICWGEVGEPTDCLALLRRFKVETECRRICGGKGSPRRREFWERVAVGERHETKRFVVDYLDCRDCP